MKNDSNLIFEAYSSKFASEKPVTNHLISQLRLMHDRLNEMSTAISLSRSPEIDQLLSHIRDLADMLITEQPNKNEDAEMPEKDFNKLKQHINKGPIQVKSNSKEFPYTHKYIHHLAKQDPREGQKEENAEDICIEDLAAKHGVSLEQLQKQLEMGLKVETEHTEDMDVAKKIALDHLNEDPDYYTKLAKMEGKNENEERRLDPKCWKGYHKQGTKMKGGKRVNNCVKNEQQEDSYSRVAHDYAERIVGAGVDDPKALAKHYLNNPSDVPEPLQHDVLKQNFEKILKYIDFTVGLNQRRKKEEEYKKKELERGPVHPDPEVGLPGSKQARYKPHYRYNPADYLPRQ